MQQLLLMNNHIINHKIKDMKQYKLCKMIIYNLL